LRLKLIYTVAAFSAAAKCQQQISGWLEREGSNLRDRNRIRFSLGKHFIAPVSHKKQPDRNATDANETNKNTAKSTKLIDILPLITVWLQVRVLPGPSAFAREAREGSRTRAQRAKTGR